MYCYSLKMEIQVTLSDPFLLKEEVREFLREKIETDDGGILVEVLNMDDEVQHWIEES